MAGIADISIRLNTDLKQFKTGMQNAQASIQSLGKNMQRLGKTLSLSLTAPLAALGAVSLKNFDAQAKAIAQVEAGLKSTGATVGYSSRELQKFASELQNISLFGDEAILKDVTAQLLTFTNIAGEQFKGTQKAALDLATRLDGDLKSASIQLGKALNDPVANLSALSRSGIQFSEQQKKVINSLATTGRLAEAQTLILAELEKQYGGSAEAAAAAGTGPLVQLKNSLGDLTEEFGAIIMDGLRPFVDWLKEAVQYFQNLPAQTKKLAVIIGTIAAAVGPILVLSGTVLPALVSGFTLLTGPVGLVLAGVTAIAYAIYKNWEPIKDTLVEVTNYFIDLYNESLFFRTSIEVITTNLKNLYAVGRLAFLNLGTLINKVAEDTRLAFQVLGAGFRAVLTGNIQDLPIILAASFKAGTTNFKEFLQTLETDAKSTGITIFENIKQSAENLKGREKVARIDASFFDFTDLTQGVADAITEGATGGGAGDGAGGPARLKKLELPTQGLATLQTTGPEAKLLTTYKKELTDFEAALVEFNMGTEEILTKTAQNFVTGFADIIGGIAAGTAGFADVAGLIIGSVADLATQLGKAAIQIGITMGALKFAFKTPGAAIATGVALVAFAALLRAAATKYAGNFSTGGIVGGTSFTGDRLTAGVNSGELILNIAQQKNLAGALRRSDATIIGGTLTADGRMLKVLLNNVDTYTNRVT